MILEIIHAIITGNNDSFLFGKNAREFYSSRSYCHVKLTVGANLNTYKLLDVNLKVVKKTSSASSYIV